MKIATRQGFLGGAAAIPVAAHVVATQTYPAGTTHPDAELIAVCTEFEAAEIWVRAVYNGPNAVVDDEQAELAAAIERDQMSVLLERMDALRASTPAGVQARAHTLALHNGDWGFSFDSDTTTTGRLLGYLMRDAAALCNFGAVVHLTSPDEAIIEAGASFNALQVKSEATWIGVVTDEDWDATGQSGCVYRANKNPSWTPSAISRHKRWPGTAPEHGHSLRSPRHLAQTQRL